jgi:predicted metal-dependent hydrolase
MKTFHLGTVLINIEYKRIKVLRMTVYPDGKVCIFAPEAATDESIKHFAESKIQWIGKHLEKFRRNVKAGNKLLRNEIHYVWGIAHNLNISEKSGRAKISAEDRILKMQIPPRTPKAKKQKVLDKWYHGLIQDTAPAIVKKWEKITGISIKKIFYRKMKTHWGSCNSQKHSIRLNTELAKKPLVCLEYVIIHEILHVIEKHHNQKFYRLLNNYFPDWKEIRKKMNKGEI